MAPIRANFRPNIRLVSFIGSREEIFASAMSLTGLSRLFHEEETPPEQPIVLIPQDVVDDFEKEFPDVKLSNLFRKMNADLRIGFAKGYNWNLGFKPAISNLVKLIPNGESMLFFSPRVIFYNLSLLEECQDQFWAARQSDNFWPEKELYGPTLDEMWRTVVGLGDGQLDDWLDLNQPHEYWRRYPAASPDLFYAPDPKLFEECYGEINAKLKKDSLDALAGQGHLPREVLITAAMAKLKGELIDPFWDDDLIYAQDFYELMLRLDDNALEWLAIEVLNDTNIRQLLKRVDEYKVIFYQNRLRRVRDGLDEVERGFSSQRMQILIRRRKIRKKLIKRLKEEQAALASK